ncbi:hypothetical protein [Streptomyces sp. enrichment culture]|uniref:hypothetical protein n=1 Tax=Streptomyces sp. enrichment culture TaxID=1795815 RepID=UPI003F56A135
MGQLSWLFVPVASGDGVRAGLAGRLRQRRVTVRTDQFARCRAGLGRLVQGASR